LKPNDRLNHAPDHAETALVLIDVINDLEFDQGEKLLASALPMASALATSQTPGQGIRHSGDLRQRQFRRWRSDFPKLVQYCLEKHVRGRPVVAQLAPQEDDYFVLKPKPHFFRPILRSY
jgi:nicotinamidase-related amidase